MGCHHLGLHFQNVLIDALQAWKWVLEWWGQVVTELWWWVEMRRPASMVIAISRNTLPNKERSVCEGVGAESERMMKNGKGKCKGKWSFLQNWGVCSIIQKWSFFGSFLTHSEVHFSKVDEKWKLKMSRKWPENDYHEQPYCLFNSLQINLVFEQPLCIIILNMKCWWCSWYLQADDELKFAMCGSPLSSFSTSLLSLLQCWYISKNVMKVAGCGNVLK